MCTLLKRILSASLCTFSLLTLPTMAQQITTGGVIHFRGAIVESPCDVNTQQQQIELSCMRDGTTRNSLYNQQQLSTTSQNVQQIATVKMHYLNEQKNMAILNIEYK
ncbi:type 1 fimbrial protein [Citrobacter europaeus]|uniref:type 1 fimbrial protein n=1 Tax=Citrobacter europaeus TaxID=1914243 RepID=UPI0039C2412B